MIYFLIILVFSILAINKIIDGYIFIPPKLEKFDPKYRLKFCYSKNNNKISFIHIQPENLSKKYIIYSHGNHTDIIQTKPYIEYLIKKNKLDINFIIYDYIGYGFSQKLKPSEKYCYESLEAVINSLIKSGISPGDIYLVGESLGTGVVINYVANNYWKNPILLISPYLSIFSVISDFLAKFPGDRFKNYQKIKNIHCGIKIAHGSDDTIININHSYKLLELIPANLKLEPVWVEAEHNNIIIFMDFKKVISDLINNK